MSKRALIVGINDFIKPDWALRGCINDSISWNELLGSYYGFEDSQIRILRDDEATGEAIRSGLAWLLSDYDLDGSDVRFFQFSSHGSQTDDQSDDEWECLDEVIVPYDHSWDEPFRDDELREIFDAIPENVALTIVADCCHSGSIQREVFDQAAELDLKPRFLDPPQDVKDRIRDLQAKRDVEADAWVAQQLTEMVQSTPPDELAVKLKDLVKKTRESYRENKYGVVSVGRHVLLAGCQDRQTSADARIEGEYRGAFSWGLAKSMREAGGSITHEQLITRTGDLLANYKQTPQLECPQDWRQRQLLSPLRPR